MKPEKELQRASNEIMRRKLKIRDLFQRIDALCAEGRLSESLFDSEGQIDSEDVGGYIVLKLIFTRCHLLIHSA